MAKEVQGISGIAQAPGPETEHMRWEEEGKCRGWGESPGKIPVPAPAGKGHSQQSQLCLSQGYLEVWDFYF